MFLGNWAVRLFKLVVVFLRLHWNLFTLTAGLELVWVVVDRSLQRIGVRGYLLVICFLGLKTVVWLI